MGYQKNCEDIVSVPYGDHVYLYDYCDECIAEIEKSFRPLWGSCLSLFLSTCKSLDFEVVSVPYGDHVYLYNRDDLKGSEAMVSVPYGDHVYLYCKSKSSKQACAEVSVPYGDHVYLYRTYLHPSILLIRFRPLWGSCLSLWVWLFAIRMTA